MIPSSIMWLFIIMVGACIGSFLNVCIYRMPREQSIVWPSSQCPNCHKAIAWYDNIPVISFLVLRARCRQCQQSILWRYPVVEVLTAAAIVWMIARFGLTPVGLIYAAFVCALIVVSFIDLEFQIIPDEISLGGLVVGFLLSVCVPQLHGTTSHELAAERALIGCLVGGGILYATGSAGNVMLYAFRWLGITLRHQPYWRQKLARYRHMRDSMGGGDIKLMAMAGTLVGWKLVLLAFFISPLLALVPGLFMMMVRRTHIIPYGPFLSLGLIIALSYGEHLLRISGIEDTVRMVWQYYTMRS